MKDTETLPWVSDLSGHVLLVSCVELQAPQIAFSAALLCVHVLSVSAEGRTHAGPVA